MVSRFARSTPDHDQVILVQSLLGTLSCVIEQDTLLSQCLSQSRCMNGYRRI